ncbi:cytochrome o ubiquinol oxidase subunit IV [Candidatus Saccharibacteria bacterium]|nr:cytochrome o ubiquinol oxidase subunit IV [Candidatus Saccharibacteria bacterium]
MKQINTNTLVAGFVFSLVLTLSAFMLVWWQKDADQQIFSQNFLLVWVGALAVVQLITQLVFFLHLGRESKPRWNLTVLVFAAIIVLILVFGSLWIMANLNYHHGPSTTPDSSIIEDEGFGR